MGNSTSNADIPKRLIIMEQLNKTVEWDIDEVVLLIEQAKDKMGQVLERELKESAVVVRDLVKHEQTTVKIAKLLDKIREK